MDNEEKKLRDELAELLRAQVDALEEETFVGLTEQGRSRCERRDARIHELGERIRNPQHRSS